MKIKECLSSETLSLCKKIDDLLEINLKLLKQMDVDGVLKGKYLPEEAKKLLKGV